MALDKSVHDWPLSTYYPLGGDSVTILCIGSLKRANSVGHINTAEFLPKNRKQFVRWKGSPALGPGSCLDYNLNLYMILTYKVTKSY